METNSKTNLDWSFKINRKVTTLPQLYQGYLKLLEALSDTFHLSNMERLILSNILTEGEYNSNVRQILLKKENLNLQVIANATTKFRKSELLVDNKPNPKLFKLTKDGFQFEIRYTFEDLK